jgi:hypothetical protein
MEPGSRFEKESRQHVEDKRVESYSYKPGHGDSNQSEVKLPAKRRFFDDAPHQGNVDEDTGQAR